MNDFLAEIEAQQKIIEASPFLMGLSIVLQIIFIVVGFILARKILKESKLTGRNGMLWAVITFLTWLFLGIFGLIPVAIFYMTNNKRAYSPQNIRTNNGEMIKCPSCNYAKNPPDAQICGLCNRPLPMVSTIINSDEQGKQCQNCADVNPATNKFCRNCGKEL